MKKILLLLIIPVFMFSCDKIIEDLEQAGSFTSTISGDIEKQFDGKAAFVHAITAQSTPNSSSLIVGLSLISDQSEAIALSLVNDTPDGIAEGTYTLTSTKATFISGYTIDNVTYAPDVTKTNTITISSVVALRVKGDFEVNLIDPISKNTIKIIGTFDAIGTTENN